MAFDSYKEKHGGAGPFAQFYDAATGGQGLFGRKGLKEERTKTDELIEHVNQDEHLRSLSAFAEAGKAPMTREEHANFRSALLQQSLNRKAIETGYEGFNARLADLEPKTVSPEDSDSLKNLRMIGEAGYALVNSGDPELVAKGQQQLAGAMTGLQQYTTQNEEQRLQLDGYERNDRNSARTEFQSQLNQNVIGPGIQDQAEYEALYAQVANLDEKAVVPTAITGAVLDYTGASLRQSDDGNWSFSFGGIGFQDKNIPTMTAGEVRNRMNQAHEGRSNTLKAHGERITALAQKQGFGVNGGQVGDLIYPLADKEYKRRETETPAPPRDVPKDINTKLRETVGDAPIDAAESFVSRIIEIGSTPIPGTGWLQNILEGKPAFPAAPALDPNSPFAKERERRRQGASGHVSGVIQRLPENNAP